MAWREDVVDGVRIIRPAESPHGATIAFSGRGHAPEEEPTPTAFLARRLAGAVGLGPTAIHWAKQVHGNVATTVGEVGPEAEAVNVGECDALVTKREGVALVVQTADCVPILLSAGSAVGAAHAGWRGSARNVAGAAVEALERLGVDPAEVSAWLGPSIGPCCYEVGGEVAAQFAGEFVRRTGCR